MTDHDCIADDNIGCPACRAEGVPEVSDWRRPAPATAPTYTASEVRILTEAALRLGRKEAGEEIAAALMRENDLLHVLPVDDPAVSQQARAAVIHRSSAFRDSARIAVGLSSQASGATSDATSGVPGHQEVSEAVRSPQEPRCGECGDYEPCGVRGCPFPRRTAVQA